MKLDLTQKEELRKSTLEFLASRPTHAYTATALRRLLRADQMTAFDFDEQDIVEALAFLEGMSMTQRETDPMGATQTFRATTGGILYVERNLAR